MASNGVATKACLRDGCKLNVEIDDHAMKALTCKEARCKVFMDDISDLIDLDSIAKSYYKDLLRFQKCSGDKGNTEALEEFVEERDAKRKILRLKYEGIKLKKQAERKSRILESETAHAAMEDTIHKRFNETYHQPFSQQPKRARADVPDDGRPDQLHAMICELKQSKMSFIAHLKGQEVGYAEGIVLWQEGLQWDPNEFDSFWNGSFVEVAE